MKKKERLIVAINHTKEYIQDKEGELAIALAEKCLIYQTVENGAEALEAAKEVPFTMAGNAVLRMGFAAQHYCAEQDK